MGRLSSSTEQALRLVVAGATAYRAAQLAGISYSTITRAMLAALGMDKSPGNLAQAYRNHIREKLGWKTLV